MVRAWGHLQRTWGAIPVPRLADEVGWSVRQLENRFREQIGLGPKAAARVLRLQRARRLLAAGRSQAETAAACGYYDQAHLSGEFRAMTGCTPREFTAARGTPSAPPPGPPGTDRMAGEATSLVLSPDRNATASDRSAIDRSAIFPRPESDAEGTLCLPATNPRGYGGSGDTGSRWAGPGAAGPAHLGLPTLSAHILYPRDARS